jgi:hypothetical protein
VFLNTGWGFFSLSMQIHSVLEWCNEHYMQWWREQSQTVGLTLRECTLEYAAHQKIDLFVISNIGNFIMYVNVLKWNNVKCPQCLSQFIHMIKILQIPNIINTENSTGHKSSLVTVFSKCPNTELAIM